MGVTGKMKGFVIHTHKQLGKEITQEFLLIGGKKDNQMSKSEVQSYVVWLK